MRRLLILAAGLSCGGRVALPNLQAQTLFTIAGRVVDAKQAPVPAATVRLYSKDPGPPLETITQLDGTFAFNDLPPGRYRLEVEMRGFEKLVRDGLNPEADASRGLSLVLQRPKPSSPVPAGKAGTQPNGTGGQAKRANGHAPFFREVDLTGMMEADATQSSSSASAASRDNGTGVHGGGAGENSDLLVISGNTSASIDAGDWGNPEFRERMREMAERMGFGGIGEVGPGGREGGFGQFGAGRGPGGGFGGGPGGGPGGGFGGGPGGGGGAGAWVLAV